MQRQSGSKLNLKMRWRKGHRNKVVLKVEIRLVGDSPDMGAFRGRRPVLGSQQTGYKVNVEK
jgi:hypothetical protein